jgi:rod shape-determining protein MreC
MSKSNSFLIILLISIFWIFDIHLYIAEKTRHSINTLKTSYFNFYDDVSNSISRYSQNIDYIEQLQNNTKQNNNYKLLYEKNLYKITQLEELLKITIKQEQKKNFKLVTTLSYKEFNDTSSLVLDVILDKKDTIYPLLNAKNYVSGIAVYEKGQSVAYLNEHKTCSYTVDIGKNGATGVMGGYSEKYKSIIIKYIPKHSVIKQGDLVVTNGLGNIFFNGIGVGVINEIFTLDSTLIATIDTYANNKEENRFFYVYKKNKAKYNYKSKSKYKKNKTKQNKNSNNNTLNKTKQKPIDIQI